MGYQGVRCAHDFGFAWCLPPQFLSENPGILGFALRQRRGTSSPANAQSHSRQRNADSFCCFEFPEPTLSPRIERSLHMFSPAGAAALHTSTEHPVPASRRPLRSAVRRAACPSGAVASARKDSSPQQKAKLVGADGAAATRRGVLLSGILGGWFASVACVDRARADDRSSAADERQGKLATLQARSTVARTLALVSHRSARASNRWSA